MTVSDTVPTVAVPAQSGPVDLPLEAPDQALEAPQAAPLLGRDRPLTTDERQFAVGLVALLLVLGTFIVVGLLLAQYVWS